MLLSTVSLLFYMFTLVYTVIDEIDKIITLFNEDYTVRQKKYVHH